MPETTPACYAHAEPAAAAASGYVPPETEEETDNALD